jgi:hypothetical protein
MTNTEKERNERRKAAFAQLKAVNPKAKWTNASKLISFRNRGNTEAERAFLESILVPAEAAGNAAAAQAVASNKNVEYAVDNAQRNVIKAAAATAKKVAGKFSRNNAKASLMRVMAKYDLKPNAILIQKLLSLHKQGKNNSEFLQELNAKSSATAAKRAAVTLKKSNKAQKVLTQKVWKNIKQQVDANVATSGYKVNALNRRALATARKNRPNLSVANFMRNRAPHRRRTRKIYPGQSEYDKMKNRYLIQRELMR